MKKLLLAVFLGLLLVSCSENYSKGERIGTVIQFSKTGFIWESWEGQLNLTQTGMNSSGEPFNFSFDNDKEGQDSLINLVSKAQSEGWKIKLIYHQVNGWNWFHNRGLTDYFIDDVKIIDKEFSKPLQNLGKDSTVSKKDTVYVIVINK